MSYIVVSPLSRLGETATVHGVREMVSLMGADQAFERPEAVGARRHLRLDMNDIVAENAGLVVPETHHIERLAAFARRWDRRTPLLLHCWMGISRSPAAALVAALALAPDQDDDALALRLRKASVFSTPNARIVTLADRFFSRDGRLVRAVRAIGRGADSYEGKPFCMTILPDDALPRNAVSVPGDG